MMNAEAVADRLEAELAPMHAAASRAAWEINILASSENEARRIEMEQAVSDFLADGERFALIEAARSGATGVRHRSRVDLPGVARIV